MADFMQRRAAVASFAALLVAACTSGSTADEEATPPQVGAGAGSGLSSRASARLQVLHDNLIRFRRDLHRHPEISGQEVRTAARIAERAERLGFNVRRNVGGHGVVAVLQGGRPGPAVAFRADMDAMPSDAADPVDFDSENPGIRHICGHDIHATIGVALAEAFAAIRQDLPGTVVLVFQPAEENITGARLMIEAGALQDPRPNAIFAYHTAPYEVGQIAYSETTLMGARDQVTATVTGGQRTRELASALRERIIALGNISSLTALQPIGSDFIWAGGGQATLGPAGAWLVNVNFSLATDAARARLREGIDQAVADVTRSAPSHRIDIDYRARWAPGVNNDAELVRRAAASIRAELGDAALVQVRNVLPAFSEDFGHMQTGVPGAMFFLGVSNESRGWEGLPHSPNYVADEEAIFVGARAMVRIMLDYLATG